MKEDEKIEIRWKEAKVEFFHQKSFCIKDIAFCCFIMIN
jgi:hypothetical protein